MAKCIKMVIRIKGNGAEYEYYENIESGDRVIGKPRIMFLPGMAFVYAPYRSRKKWKRELFIKTREGLLKELEFIKASIDAVDKLNIAEGGGIIITGEN